MYKAVRNTFQYHYLKDEEVPEQVLDSRNYYDSLRKLRIKAARSNRKPKIDSSIVVRSDNKKLGVKPNAMAINVQSNLNYPEQIKLPEDPLDNTIAEIPQHHVDKSLEAFDAYYDADRGGLPTNNVIALQWGTSKTRSAKNLITSRNTTIKGVERDQIKYRVTLNKQIAKSLACFVMFFIGAPIGAIIKKGGIGLPVIISVIFFLIYYILNTSADKLAKEDVFDPALVVWFANFALLPFGLFFLKQAQNDARLFEPDVYVNFFNKIKFIFRKKEQIKAV